MEEVVEQLRDPRIGNPDVQAGEPGVGSSSTSDFLQMIGQEVPSSGITVEYFGHQESERETQASGSETEASEEMPMQLEHERSHQEVQLEQEKEQRQVQPQRQQNDGQQKQHEEDVETVSGPMMAPTTKRKPTPPAMSPPAAGIASTALKMAEQAAEMARMASQMAAGPGSADVSQPSSSSRGEGAASGQGVAAELSLADQLNLYHAAERQAAQAYNVNWKERGPPAPLHPGYKFLNQSYREREGNPGGSRWGNRGGRNKLYWEVARKHGHEAAAHLWVPADGEKGGGGKGKEGGRKGGVGKGDGGKTGVCKGDSNESSDKGGGGKDGGSKGAMGMGGGKGSGAHGAGVGGEHRQVS